MRYAMLTAFGAVMVAASCVDRPVMDKPVIYAATTRETIAVTRPGYSDWLYQVASGTHTVDGHTFVYFSSSQGGVFATHSPGCHCHFMKSEVEP